MQDKHANLFVWRSKPACIISESISNVLEFVRHIYKNSMALLYDETLTTKAAVKLPMVTSFSI